MGRTREEISFSEELEMERLYKEEFWTKKAIAEHFRCSTYILNKIFKERNIETVVRRVNRNLKENFFETIDSEEKAYILGLLFTDGSIGVRKGKPSSMKIELQIGDIAILEKIKEVMKIDSKLTISTHKNRSGSTTKSATLSVHNQKLVSDLAKYGVVPRKTYVTKHLPDIPKQYRKDFMRGLIDGDGSIYSTQCFNKKYQKYYRKKVIYFCSLHESICEDFRIWLKEILQKDNVPRVSIEKDSCRITLSGTNDVRKVAAFLYKDSHISLARKYKLAKNIYEGNNGEDIVYSD